MGTSNSHPSPQKRYLTLREAVDQGFGAYSTLRKYISEGKLPAVRQGRRIRIRQSDLESLLNQNSRTIDHHIAEVVNAAPRLSEDQIARLRLALGGGR